jgi:hypothetical protein
LRILISISSIIRPVFVICELASINKASCSCYSIVLRESNILREITNLTCHTSTQVHLTRSLPGSYQVQHNSTCELVMGLSATFSCLEHMDGVPRTWRLRGIGRVQYWWWNEWRAS